MLSPASFDIRGGVPFGSVCEANGRSGGLSSGDECQPARARDDALRMTRLGMIRVDTYVAVHNNTFMKHAALAPVILLNTVRSAGATG